MKSLRRSIFMLCWACIAVLLVGCSKPPSFDHDVEVLRKSAESARQNLEDAKDPEKRQKQLDEIERGLKNPPRIGK